MEKVLALPMVTVTDVVSQREMQYKEVQILYKTHKEFEANAKKLKIMYDFRVSVNTNTG